MSNAKTKSEPKSTNQPLTPVQQLLVAQYAGFASKISKQFRPPAGMESGDLEQIAVLGLIEAARRFDGRHGARFTTYAFPDIRGHIVNAIKSHGIISVPVRYDRAKSDICEETRQARIECAQAVRQVAPLDEDFDAEADIDTFIEVCTKEQLELLKDALATLTDTERDFIMARMSGESLKKLAERLGFGYDRAVSVEKSIMLSLRSQVQAAQ